MLRFFINLFVILFVAAPVMAQAKYDKKLYQRAADRVWKTKPEMFDPKVVIPDSLAKENSAVVLAECIYIDGKLIVNENELVDRATRTERYNFCRRMVKILGPDALKELARHKFGGIEEAGGRITVYRSVNAFGARIIKPDGAVVDVDLSAAIPDTEGKKGKASKSDKLKIDIPGLEIGDILDYFTYNESEMREFDLPALGVTHTSKYPVLHFYMGGRFTPKLTVEFRTYNGAPDLMVNTTPKENTFSLELTGIPVVHDEKFLCPKRQLPFYEFYICNNESMHRFYPASVRHGGLRGNPAIGTVYRDISLTLANSIYDASDFPSKLRKLYSNYRKANPEATKRQLLDAAWLASVYLNQTDKHEDNSDYWLALMFSDFARKQSLVDSIGVGFLNSREDVATAEIIHREQPDFGPIAEGTIFLPNHLLNYLPGEIPGHYQGEKGAYYPGDRERLQRFTLPTVFNAPIERAGKNRAIVNISLTSAEEGAVEASTNIVLSGSQKRLADNFNNLDEWAETVEEYLGIPENKRYRNKERDDVARAEEVKDAAKDLYNSLVCHDGESTVSDVAVTSRGIIPGKPNFEISFNARTPDIVTDAGSEMLIPVGKFVGADKRLDGKQRERQLYAFLNTPMQYQYNLTVRVPEGYTATPEALEALKSNLLNNVGMYFTDARIGEDGNVEIFVRSSFNTIFVPLERWNDLLDILDAEAAFGEANLILTPAAK